MKQKTSMIVLLLLLSVNFSNGNNVENTIARSGGNPMVSMFLSLVSNLLKSIQLMSVNTIMTVVLNFVDGLVQAFFPPPIVPHLPQDLWWGNEDHHKNTSIRPFEIILNPERIKRLLIKLNYQENFTIPLHNAAFTYGTNTNFLKQVLEYWLNKYDFDAREKRMNKFPQYMINIQGLDINFIHIKPRVVGKKTIPLLMIHGWPLTNLEFFYVFPKLIEPRKDRDFVFEVIAPSIPGHGYSEGTSKIGLSPYQIGIIFKNLMKKLGIEKFYIHAGDIGQFIATDMITMYQKDILGFHTNLPYSFLPRTIVKYMLGSIHPSAVVKPEYAERLYPISSRLYYYITKFGYFHIQATFPDNLSVGLSDSPSGIAAWLLSSIAWATNPMYVFHNDGKIFDNFSIDDILDYFTVMWDAEYLPTSMRLYAETTAVFQDPTILKLLISPTIVPFAAIKFRNEIIYNPDNFLKDKYPNLCHSTTIEFGGHLASLENPKILTDDIWKAVDKMRQFHRNRNLKIQPFL